MSKRLLAVATSIMMAAPLLAVPGFAQAPPAPSTQAPAPAAPAPAAPAMSAPSTATPPAGAKPPHRSKSAAAHPGAHMDRVKQLQTALNSNGASLTVDGKMGPKTKDALMTFQKAHNLKPTGRPDKETRAALMK